MSEHEPSRPEGRIEGIPVELVGVRIELPTNQPIVLLREVGGQRFLPIWIGANEATAIAFALEGVEPQRPLTHDLLKASIEALGSTVDRIVVTELKDGIYYADLVFLLDDREISVSSRPSDAIALAARTGSPIFVFPGVLEEAGVEIRDEEEEEDEIQRFRNFLDSVNPEDFGNTA
jgi:bifunctional DNase/RNase